MRNPKSALVPRSKLQILVQSGAVKKCTVTPSGDRWMLRIEAGDKLFVLATTNNTKKVREFTSLDTAAGFVHDVGIGLITVELANRQTKQKTLALR